MSRDVTVACKISRSAFSGERIFHLTLPGRIEHVGAASVDYFRKKNGKPLDASEPGAGQKLDGKIVARVVEWRDDQVVASLPDGDVVTLSANQVTPETLLHVPLES